MSPSATPIILLQSVWPLPRSLATTCGISVDYFSSPYLDVSVQAVPHAWLFDSPCVTWGLLRWVSPFGYLRIVAYLQLPEAFRSLSRPSSAPDAKAFPLRSYKLDHCTASRSAYKLCRKIHFWFLFFKNYAGSIRSFSLAEIVFNYPKLKCFLTVAFSLLASSSFYVQFSRYITSGETSYHSLPLSSWCFPSKAHSFRSSSFPNSIRFAGFEFGFELFDAESLKAHWNPRLETSINLRRKVLFSSWSAKRRSAIPSKLNNEKFHKWNFWFDFVKSSLLRSILTERPWTTDHRMLRLF